jgi:hypothetical protein
MNFVFESLCTHEVSRATVSSEENNSKGMMSIKMMDTILFEEDFKPKKWIFTDLLGRIQFKEITSITIKDVIRAFLLNLNHNRKQEFNNEDLIEFLSNNSNRSKICFAINQNKRYFLGIESLSDIINRFPRGIEAL